jgi:hypothetical protein
LLAVALKGEVEAERLSQWWFAGQRKRESLPGILVLDILDGASSLD